MVRRITCNRGPTGAVCLPVMTVGDGWCRTLCISLTARHFCVLLFRSCFLVPHVPYVRRRNPFYKNEKKTIEPHLLHTFPTDFYGEELRLLVVGYIRPELSFSSLDALITAINSDISTAREQLDHEEYKAYDHDTFLLTLPAAPPTS